MELGYMFMQSKYVRCLVDEKILYLVLHYMLILSC